MMGGKKRNEEETEKEERDGEDLRIWGSEAGEEKGGWITAE